MVRVKAEGYADVTALQEKSAAISKTAEIEMMDGKTREKVLELCHQFAELLKPFALTYSTNERWRDEVLEATEKVHATAQMLGIEDPVMETLTKGVDGLGHYGDMIQSVGVPTQMIDESLMDAHEMMDGMVQAVEQLAASIDTDPPDEWQLKKDTNTVDSFGSALSFKLIDYYNKENTCARAERLLTRVAEVMNIAANREGISEPLKNSLIHFANGALKRKERIAQSGAEVREKEREREQKRAGWGWIGKLK